MQRRAERNDRRHRRIGAELAHEQCQRPLVARFRTATTHARQSRVRDHLGRRTFVTRSLPNGEICELDGSVRPRPCSAC